MDANEEQKIKRQRNAEHKKKEAAARQAIIDEIVAQSPKTAPDRSPVSTRTARAIPAERLTFAKPQVAAYANGAGPQHRAMHSGSTALRTPAAITIEKTVSLALEEVQEEPVDEKKEDHATCSAASEHLMLDAEEQAADRQDRIRQYKQFAARVEKKRQLQDAARAQTKQDDADAEIQMLVAAEVNRQTKQDQTVRYRTVKDPVRPDLTPKSAEKAHKDAIELAKVTELLDSLSTVEQTNPQGDVSFGFREPPRSSVVLPAEKLVLGNMVQSEIPARPRKTRNPRKTLSDQSMGHDLFADPRMTFSDAATQMDIYLNAAHGITSHWCKVGGDHFSNCLSDPLLQRHIEELTRDLSGIAAFLSHGRLGRELQDLPREFFEKVDLLLPELKVHLTLVIQYKGGERLTGALEATDNIDARLKSIWLMKLAQGDQRLDEDMDEA